MKQVNEGREIVPAHEVWSKDMIPTDHYYVRKTVSLRKLRWVAGWAKRLRAKAEWHFMRRFAEECDVDVQSISSLIHAINDDDCGEVRVEVGLSQEPVVYVFTLYRSKEVG